MNLFIPTSAVVMGGLAIARVPYGTYLRWVWPLLAVLGGGGHRHSRHRSRHRLEVPTRSNRWDTARGNRSVTDTPEAPSTWWSKGPLTSWNS